MIRIHLIRTAQDECEIVGSTGYNRSSLLTEKRRIRISLLKQFIEGWESFFLTVTGSDADTRGYYKELEKKSRYLTNLLFNVKEINLDNHKGIKFYFEPELAGIPFEVIRTAGGYLSDICKVQRILRVDHHLQKESVNSGRGGVCIFDDRTSGIQQGIAKERSKLRKLTLQNKNFSARFFNVSNLQKVSIYELLSDARWFHFGGHTSKGDTTISEYFNSREISNLDLSNLRAVFLNSCFSASGSTGLDTLAYNFIKAGAGNVLGYHLQIRDDLAAEMSYIFWLNFLKSGSFSTAVERLRKELNNSADVRTAFTRFIISEYSTEDNNQALSHFSLKISRFLPKAVLSTVALLAIGYSAFLYLPRFLSINTGEKQRFIDNQRNQKTQEPGKKSSRLEAEKNKKGVTLKEGKEEQIFKAPESEKLPEQKAKKQFNRLAEKLLSIDHPYYSKEELKKHIAQTIKEYPDYQQRMYALKRFFP